MVPRRAIMVDRYTKAVLTVIAACLMWIVARDVQLVPEARAQAEAEAEDGMTQVEVVGWSAGSLSIGAWSAGRLDVAIDRIGRDAGVNAPLPVRCINCE
jgi:hypothetical protein